MTRLCENFMGSLLLSVAEMYYIRPSGSPRQTQGIGAMIFMLEANDAADAQHCYVTKAGLEEGAVSCRRSIKP